MVNDNIQVIQMWLATADTTMMDNALVTMEYLYRAGSVKVCLRGLIHESSYYEISYYLKKQETSGEFMDGTQANITTVNDGIEREASRGKLVFKLSLADIDDHKRQLTFCNADLVNSRTYRSVLLEEQMKLLSIIEKIYRMQRKLEMSGHPNYQMKEEHWDICDTYGQ